MSVASQIKLENNARVDDLFISREEREIMNSRIICGGCFELIKKDRGYQFCDNCMRKMWKDLEKNKILLNLCRDCMNAATKSDKINFKSIGACNLIIKEKVNNNKCRKK